jgi:hypothetical protein
LLQSILSNSVRWAELSCIPLVSREVRPFHVSADFITAGQNGATFSDQSAALISWHHMQQWKISFYDIYWYHIGKPIWCGPLVGG